MNQQPFDASVSSLQQYQTPDWFRDAKFGIWSHWGPNSVARQGDWYARRMYMQGEEQYEHHFKNYGHPSKHGYKDLIPLWKAENWNPEALMELYVKAGAKYFVSMASFHDNFDLWNSKFHRWNAVNMGPQRDIVGDWQAAACKRGLPFGVSEHLSASYLWFQVSHGADQSGPLAGVPYDGADPEFQDLYHAPDEQIGADNQPWFTSRPEAHADWARRMTDLVDSYQPDLIYTDGALPFGEAGRTVISHFYNNNMQRNNGQLEAVYTYKKNGLGEYFPDMGVLDVERGGLQGIHPDPWQTDTSIGDWFFSENYPYKPTSFIIHLLCDIVSKNGNLLLNVVQYPDGSLPPECQQFLQEMAQWMPINGEAIYGTRPWKTWGESPDKSEGEHFHEDNAEFSARDIRFTQKDGELYAMTLGVPNEKVVIQSLASDSALIERDPAGVALLGYDRDLSWKRTPNGLEIDVPANLNLKHALAFKISGL